MMLALIRGIRNNFIRCFKGYRFILGISGVIGVFILSLLDYGNEIRVIHAFVDSFQTITFLSVIMFLMLPVYMRIWKITAIDRSLQDINLA